MILSFSFRTLVQDPLSYLMAILLFLINTGFSSIPVYLPTILADMGNSSINAQGLSAPPYVRAISFPP